MTFVGVIFVFVALITLLLGFVALVTGGIEGLRINNRSKAGLVMVGGVVLLVVAAAIVPDARSDKEESDASATTAARVTTTAAAPTTTPSLVGPTATQSPAPAPTTAAAAQTPPYPTHTQCRPASDGYVSTINAAFADSSQQLLDAFEVSGPKDITYIGANIYRGTDRLSSADVWAARGGVIYALSGDARKRTQLPDGRKILDISAGDDYGTMVSDCVGNAAWERNHR